jgi:hypothetical protein
MNLGLLMIRLVAMTQTTANISAMIIPGKTGSIHKCATQVTSMLTEKPSETFALVSRINQLETDALNEIRYIGKIRVHPAYRPSELMTTVFKYVNNDCVAFIDGDARIGPSTMQKMISAFSENPNRVYCSALKGLGDIEGYVYGCALEEKGSSPLAKKEKLSGLESISCLHHGCIFFPRKALELVSIDGPCSCMEELSVKMADAGFELVCVRDAAINYKGLVNFGVTA